MSDSLLQKRPIAMTNSVIFDIDNTIAYQHWGLIDKYLPVYETTTVEYFDMDYARHEKHCYLIAPHFDVLVKYLLSQDCQVNFFSLGHKERNEPFVDRLLSDERFLGCKRYCRLKEEKQFQVFSNHQCAYLQKPLKQTLLPGQTLDDVILVDDSTELRHDGNEDEETKIPYAQWSNREDSSDAWSLHYMYCIIGLFKDYFENAKPQGVALRHYVQRLEMVPTNTDKRPIMVPKDYAKFIVAGLQEVRKTKPNAFYFPVDPSRSSLVNPDPSLTAPPLEYVKELVGVENRLIPEAKVFLENFKTHYKSMYDDMVQKVEEENSSRLKK